MIMQRIARARPADGLPTPLTSNAILKWLGGSLDNASGVDVTRQTVLGHPSVKRAVDLLAETVGRIPLKCYRNLDTGGREEDENHSATKILRRRPNPFMSAYNFKCAMQRNAASSGNGVARIFRDNRGFARELYPLDPDATWPVITHDDEGRPMVLYKTRLASREYTFLAENALHIMSNSSDGIWGDDPVTVCAEALGLGLALQRHSATYFKNNASPKLVITADPGVRGFKDAEEVEEFRKNWQKVHGGAENQNKPAILQPGMKIETLGDDAEQSQLNASDVQQIRRIANIFGIPSFLLGDPAPTSYNSLEIMNKAFSKYSMGGWFRAWAEECEFKLLGRNQYGSTHSIDWTLEALEEADKKTETDTMLLELNNGTLTLNEYLKIKNRPTAGEEGERRRIPSTIIFTDQDSAQADPYDFQAPEVEPIGSVDQADEAAEEMADENGRAVHVFQRFAETMVDFGMRAEKRGELGEWLMECRGRNIQPLMDYLLVGYSFEEADDLAERFFDLFIENAPDWPWILRELSEAV